MPRPRRRAIASQRSLSLGNFIAIATIVQLSGRKPHLARKPPALPGQRRLPLILADQAGAAATPPRRPRRPRRDGRDRPRRGWRRPAPGRRAPRAPPATRTAASAASRAAPATSAPRSRCSSIRSRLKRSDRVAPGRRRCPWRVDVVDEAVDPALLQRRRQPVPVGQRRRPRSRPCRPARSRPGRPAARGCASA